ncbi:hypothetical protein OfM1_04570 [Lactovum odontotermitis]
MIELDKIDTTVAAKNFANLLENRKTYFLNGEWGSGKTWFINEVKNQSSIKLLNIYIIKKERPSRITPLATSP